MKPELKNLMRDRQQPLVALYQEQPEAAWVVDSARTEWKSDDPLHSSVWMGPADPIRVPIAVHRAVGGESDEAVPGDLLAAALASCFDSTCRVVANRLRIDIRHLAVTVRAEVDVRGTLLVSSTVPVAFQRMSVRYELELGEGTKPGQREMLVGLTEKCCVVFQTLKNALPVDVQPAERRTEAPDPHPRPSL